MSEFMVHDFDQVSDLLILRRLYKPLSKVALYCHVQHLLLLARQPCSLNLLLHLNKLGIAQLHHLSELLRAEEKRRITKLSRKRHLHELESRDQS